MLSVPSFREMRVIMLTSNNAPHRRFPGYIRISRRSTSVKKMNGYINLPMKISHSDDDSGLPVSGESMWGADRVIKLDDESSEITSAAQTTWEATWLAVELPNEVGQQQGCSQPTGFQTWMGEHLKRRKDQEHESTREISKAACYRKLQPPSSVGVRLKHASR